MILAENPTFQLRPDVVRIEELERFHRLEVVDMLAGHLCDFQQSQLVLVLDEGAALDVGARLVRHLHDELVFVRFAAQQIVQDVQINGGAQIVDVRQEAILATLADELLQQARVLERFVEVTVAGRIPTARCVGGGVERMDENL